MSTDLHPFTAPEGWTAEPGRAPGFHVCFTGPNGYGASVIQNSLSYGREQGMYEVAVLDAEGILTYDTPVTSDVIGWLDVDGVNEVLEQIAALEAES